MSRLVIFLGIILIVLGGVGVVFGFVGMPAQFTNLIDQAVTPTAAELCNPGETLDEVTGAEEYTPLEGYRRSVQYYCVDEAGVRRDVTGTFVQDMLGQVLGSMGGLAVPLVSSCLFVPGIILVILGELFSRRRAALADGNVVVRTYSYGSPSTSRFQFPDDPNAPTPSNQPASSDPTARLQKLDAVRNAGLITDEEYVRIRQEILDSMS